MRNEARGGYRIERLRERSTSLYITIQVASLQTPSDDIYLPEDRPQVMISNAIKGKYR